MNKFELPQGILLENRYEVNKVLGKGGFGITYAGVDTRLGTKVAVKEYFPQAFCVRSEDGLGVEFSEENRNLFSVGLEHFKTEARNLSQISGNTNIVYVRDFFEENNTCYIIMEYVEGTTLKEKIAKDGKMNFDDVFLLMNPLMDAVSVLHGMGMIHRDISPENLILTSNNILKLLDFGAAKQISNSPENHTVMYKQGYAPLEQYASVSVLDERTDVYGVAATIYFCITGQAPAAVLDRASQDILVAPSALGAIINEKAEAALIKGLALFRENRWKTIKDFQDALLGKQVIYTSDKVESGETVLQLNTPASVSYDTKEAKEEKIETPVVRAESSQEMNEEIPEVHKPANYEEKKSSKKSKNSDNAKAAKKEKKKKKNFFKIFGVLVAVVVVIIVFSTVYRATSTISIGDKSFKRSDTSVYVSGSKIPVAQLKKIHNFRDLRTLSFNYCFLENSDIEIIADEIQKIGSKNYLTIRIVDNREVTDISPLANISNLKFLEIAKTSVKDVSCLKNNVILEGLDISNLYTDLNTDSMRDLISIKQLVISDNGIKNLDFLSNYTGLTQLNASNNEISDLSGLSNCELQYLNLDNNKITDLTALTSGLDASAPYIELYISDNGVQSLEPLRDVAHGLNYLYADNNDISDISILEQAKDIKQISLIGNHIKDISMLADCYKLYILQLGYNEIEDVTAITDLQNLSTLGLESNKIKDISSWNRTYDIERLYISNNEIRDISNLTGMPQLQTLWMNGNEIEDISCLSSLSELEYLRLYDNKISDISPMMSFDKDPAHGKYKNNNITDFSPLNHFYEEGNKESATLFLGNIVSVYGNTNLDYKSLSQLSLSALVISYSENINWSELAVLNTSSCRLVIIDAPKNLQHDLKEKCSSFSSVTFFDSTEYDQEPEE